MPKNLLKISMIIILVTLFSIKLKAQLMDELLKGTITTTSGEEINGYVKTESLAKFKDRILLKKSLNEKDFKTFTPESITTLKLENGEKYESLSCKIPNSQDSVHIIARLMLQGDISVYETYKDSRSIYILLKKGKTYWLQDDILESGNIEMTKYRFRAVLYEAIRDSEVSTEKVERITFSDKGIISAITEYNNFKLSTNEFKKSVKNSASFIIAGAKGMLLNSTNYEYSVDGYCRIYYPNISRSTSINLGISYNYRNYSYVIKSQVNSNYNSSNEYTYNYFSLPMFFRQNILNKNIRPAIYGGINFYYLTATDINNKSLVGKGFQKEFGFGVAFGLGIEFDILKQFMIVGDFHRDTINHLATVGIGYKLSTKYKK